MSLEKQLNSMRLQAIRYCYVDGLAEIALGFIFMVGALGLALLSAFDRTYALIIGIILVPVILGMAFWLERVVQSLKEAITYPRTGYVEADDVNPSLWLEIFVAIGILLLSVGYALVDDKFATWLNTEIIFNGFILFIIMAYTGYRAKLSRFYSVAIIALALATLLALLNISDEAGTVGVYGGTGLILSLLGISTLRRYLQTYPTNE